MKVKNTFRTLFLAISLTLLTGSVGCEYYTFSTPPHTEQSQDQSQGQPQDKATTPASDGTTVSDVPATPPPSSPPMAPPSPVPATPATPAPQVAPPPSVPGTPPPLGGGVAVPPVTPSFNIPVPVQNEPADKAVDVSVSPDIVVTFSDATDVSSVKLSIKNNKTGAVTYDHVAMLPTSSKTTFMLPTPYIELENDGQYTASVTWTWKNTSMSPYEWSFQTIACNRDRDCYK